LGADDAYSVNRIPRFRADCRTGGAQAGDSVRKDERLAGIGGT